MYVIPNFSYRNREPYASFQGGTSYRMHIALYVNSVDLTATVLAQ
jgi:hypothetical protein